MAERLSRINPIRVNRPHDQFKRHFGRDIRILKPILRMTSHERGDVKSKRFKLPALCQT